MIAIVMLLIYILRNIVTINYSLASNSLKTVTLVIGFFITSAYFFSRSIREAQQFIVGCGFGNTKWFYRD